MLALMGASIDEQASHPQPQVQPQCWYVGRVSRLSRLGNMTLHRWGSEARVMTRIGF